MIKVKQFCFNAFAVSTFVVYDSDSGQAAVIDPGMLTIAEREEFDRYIAENNLTITQIINTHLHLDHCFGDNYVRNKYGVKIYAHKGDAMLGLTIGEQAARFGITLNNDAGKVEIDVNLNEGDTIEIGKYKLLVLHVPGHSPGSIALYCPDGEFVISGDVLFQNSIGRTDLPGGNFNTLIQSIKTKLLTLPDNTAVLPGHDEFTDIRSEKRFNPYLK